MTQNELARLLNVALCFYQSTGVAMIAPMINPYEPSMTKEEMAKTWEQWLRKRKFIYFLARQWPSLLPFFYRRSFLSGNLEPLDQWMSISLGEKVSLYSSRVWSFSNTKIWLTN